MVHKIEVRGIQNAQIVSHMNIENLARRGKIHLDNVYVKNK